MEQEVKMNITKAIRDKIKKEVDIDEILPDKLPVYVSSFVYMFGIITLVSLIVIILSGFIMVSKGVLWYQTSPLGFFFRSMHFWGVQVFFFFLTLHYPFFLTSIGGTSPFCLTKNICIATRRTNIDGNITKCSPSS